MPKKYKKIAWHLSAFSVRMLGVLCFLIFGLAVSFMWRVSQSPLDISFAKQYIQSAMRDAETGNYALIDRAVLFWPDLKGPLFLEVEGGQLLNQDDATILSVNMAALSFSRAGLLSGRVMPKAIILKSPTLKLLRTEQGSIEFDLGHVSAESEQVGQEEQLELTTRIFGYIARPGIENANKSLISKLQSFSIEDARLVVDDRIAQQSWSLPDFNVKLASTRAGMDGNISLKLPDVGLEESSLNVDLNYVWDQKNVEVSAHLKTFDVQALAQKVPELGMLADQNLIVDAHIETILDETFTPADVRLDISSKKGSLQHPDLSDEPVPYSDLALNATYNYLGKTLKVTDTKVTLKDITLFAEGEVTHTKTQIAGPVKVWIDETEHKYLAPLWPNALRGDNAKVWIIDRMSDATFKDAWVKFDIMAQKQSADGQAPAWDADIKNLETEFSFEELTADYRAPLDAGRNLYGSGRFDLEKDELTIDIRRGVVGKMAVKDASLMFRDITKKGQGKADLSIPLKSKVADVMRFISKEPINLGDELDMDINKVKGDADIRVSLQFPTVKDVRVADFKIGITGSVDNILLPDVIETLDLSGGPLAFNIKDGLVSMKGKAMLEKRDMDFEWSTYLNSKGKPYDEKIRARLTVDPNLRQILGVDLSDFIEGSLPADISYVRQRSGSAKANVKVDATPALFFVEPFNFAKKSGDEGSASFDAHFKKGRLQKITDLSAKGVGFNLPKAEIIFTQVDGKTMLQKGSLSNFDVDITKGSVDFAFDDRRVVTINMKAAIFDARPFMEGGDANTGEPSAGDSPEQPDKGERYAYDEPPMKIFLSADSMRTAANKNVGATKIYMDIDGNGRFNQMEMDADLKKGKVSVRYKPDEEGVRTFRLESNNAGEFLNAFDVYTNILGGSVTIFGESIKGVNDRNLRGKARIRNFRVVKAPALTKILSILSLTGIGEALTSDGLDFSKLEADFNWVYRKNGSLLKMKNGRTSGNVLGLLFKGTFDNASRTVDVDGTIVPMSGLNKIIGKIPLVGDILTGGSGGVFAATYSIKGKSDNPTIGVNPLSVIAPGIIRRVLFE